MDDISKGGSYVRDPKTGKLERVEFTADPAPADAVPEPANSAQPEPEQPPAAPTKEGKK